MSLQKQLVHLNMRGGQDTKLDDRLVIPSKLASVRDAVFEDPGLSSNSGSITHRGGLTSHNLTYLRGTGVTVSSPRRLFSNQGNLLIEADSALHQVIKSYGQVSVRPAGTGLGGALDYKFYRAGALTRPVGGNIEKWPTTYTPSHAGQYDFASSGAFSCWAWEERDSAGSGRMAVRISICDEQNQQIVASYLLNDTSGTNYIYACPRVVYDYTNNLFHTYFARFASGSTTFAIQCASISSDPSLAVMPAALTANTVMTEGTAGGTTGSSGNEVLFDATFDGSSWVFLSLRRNSTSQRDLTVYRLTASNGYTINGSGTLTLAVKPTTLTCYPYSSTAVDTFYDNSNTVRAVRWSSLTAFGAETTIATGAAATSVGRIAVSVSGSEYRILYDNSTTATFASPVTPETTLRYAYCTISSLGSSGGGSLLTGWLLAGRPSTVRSRLWVPVFLPSATQPTVYVVDMTAPFTLGSYGLFVVARLEYGECGYLQQDWCAAARVPATTAIGDTLTVGFPKWVSDAQIVSGSFVQPVQINRADIDFAASLGHAEVNGLTYLAGACPHIYDGRSAVEEGFHHAPEIGVLSAVGAGSGNLINGLAAGTYYLTCTMGWQDAAGNWHESAPAEPRSVTTSAGNPDVSVAYTMTPPTQKENARVIWYRTIASAASGPFYRAFDQTGTAITSDATLVNCEQLYTTPGVEGQALYHDPAPACRHIENHQKRLFLAGVGDGTGIAFSNTIQPGRGVEFSVLLDKWTDYEFGRIVGTQSQDGKLYVLGERKIGVLLGAGPTDTGEQDGYSEIEPIIHEAGAKWGASNSVVSTDDGVWFQSSVGGLRLLGRNGALARRQDGQLVGTEVDGNLGTALTVTRAVVGDLVRQVRFYTNGGEVLLYDSSWGQWSVFSNHTCVDAAFAHGRFYHITSTPKLLYYNESAYTDDGTAISMSLEFPWLQFAGIQGLERITRIMFLGAPVDVTTDTQVVSLQIATNFDLAGATTPINAQDVTTSNARLTQFEHQPATQKMESLKMLLTIKSKTSASRFRLSDVTLQVGVKQGRFKLPSTRRL